VYIALKAGVTGSIKVGVTGSVNMTWHLSTGTAPQICPNPYTQTVALAVTPTIDVKAFASAGSASGLGTVFRRRRRALGRDRGLAHAGARVAAVQRVGDLLQPGTSQGWSGSLSQSADLT